MHILFLLFCALVTSSASARERTTIAVVGVHQETLTQDAQTAAIEEIAETIEKLGKFDALLPRDLTWIIQGREEVILQDAFTFRGRRLLDDGKTLYAQAQADEATPVLEAAVDELIQSMSATNAQADLWDALFLLGTAKKAIGEDATEAWTRAIALNPAREPNASQYPPPVVQAYQKLQTDHLANRGKLVIDGDQPGLKIWVNGENRGVTPLSISDVPLGEVHIMARDAQGQQAYQRTTVTADTPAKITMTADGGQWGLATPSVRDRVVGTSDLYRAIGKHAEVNLILVVGQNGANVSLQLYSPRMDSFSNPLTKPVTGTATDEIIAALPELLQLATEDGAILSMATTPDAAPLTPRTNPALGKLLLSPDPVTAPPGGKIKWWHLAIAGGSALAIGGVVTGVIVGGSDDLDPNQGVIVVGPIP